MFAIALIPALRGPQKPPFWTSFITGLMLMAYVVSFITLHMWWSGASCFLCALGWLALAQQRA